ncbi:hypothetical protein HYFRA_00007831 [Hymenoscyphus fraxineus]|uniref:Telomere length regulation protein conserved domain-containing protein n=1 Tax=Hymenoscyphus fraxineus TaxID=746836 RepID=A0A9N9PNC9_9HELO|nr:hypothetical protein HYFRA_00007831 [Hymenoscyphus fraxineus]
MDGFLTPVSTTYKSNPPEKKEDFLVEIPKISNHIAKPSLSNATSPSEALNILKSEPDHDALIKSLRYLIQNESDFKITSPSPISSQLVHVLVSEVLPNYWSIFSGAEGPKSKRKRPKQSAELQLLLKCLRSVTGLNSIILSMKRHIQLSKGSNKKVAGGPNVEEILNILLEASAALLQGSGTVQNIASTIWDSNEQPTAKKSIWNEFLGLIGGGKLLGIAAEAEAVVHNLSENIGQRYWVADGTLFSVWLTTNLQHWVLNLPKDSEHGWKCCGELLGKLLRLGKSGNIIEKVVGALLDSLILGNEDKSAQFITLLNHLPTFEQKNVLYSTLQFVSREKLSTSITTEADSSWWKSDAKVISGASSLIKSLVSGAESRSNQLMAWLTSSSGAGVGESIAIRRAVVAVIAEEKSSIESLLEKSIQQFGDQLYVRHTPTIQQEVQAQILLLSAGCLHRKAPLRLSMMMRAGTHLNAVSHRLAESSPRTRFLGMAVGEALSSLVDKGDKKMDFKVDEMSTAEAKWYKSLVNVVDTVGSIDSLKTKLVPQAPPKSTFHSKPAGKPAPSSGASRIISIEEVEDDEDEEEEDSDEDDLTPYGKPDSDEEDSDEDATNIVRNKPTAPVYIRDLITYLRDTDNYDRQKLGLQTAAPLIRRKANFGTEVSTHAEELATLLVGIQDKYEIEEFQELRLQGMIAILLALPSKMGPWFAKTFFDGDYSMSQRASVLTTLGLSARELGGFGKEDIKLTKTDQLPSTSFPSKALPEKMHNLYITNTQQPKKATQKSLPFSALTIVSANLTSSLTKPIAAEALASSSNPAIMNFNPSSTRQITKTRTRPKLSTNALSTIASTTFFFPLTGRFFIHLRAYGSSSTNNITFDPFLLSLFIKTLALILDAAGPYATGLRDMRREFWDLLLGLRVTAMGERGVIESMLFGFLVSLELNANDSDGREIVEGMGRELLEIQGWVQGVFEGLGEGRGVSVLGVGRRKGEEGGGVEEEKVRVLAASVLVRIQGLVERYRGLLVGDLVSYS